MNQKQNKTIRKTNSGPQNISTCMGEAENATWGMKAGLLTSLYKVAV